MILALNERLQDLIVDVRALVIKGTSAEWVREYGMALDDEVTQHFNEGLHSARLIAKSIIDDYYNAH